MVNRYDITKYKDERGVILTYAVWDYKTIEEVKEFNTLKEARAFMKTIQEES